MWAELLFVIANVRLELGSESMTVLLLVETVPIRVFVVVIRGCQCPDQC